MASTVDDKRVFVLGDKLIFLVNKYLFSNPLQLFLVAKVNLKWSDPFSLQDHKITGAILAYARQKYKPTTYALRKTSAALTGIGTARLAANPFLAMTPGLAGRSTTGMIQFLKTNFTALIR